MQHVYKFLTHYILKIVIGNLYESKCGGVEYMISLKHSTYYLILYLLNPVPLPTWLRHRVMVDGDIAAGKGLTTHYKSKTKPYVKLYEHSSLCRKQAGSEKMPYHYYKPRGPDECHTYIQNESSRRGYHHRFITEKQVFSRWAKQYNIKFTHPTWWQDW